MLWLLAIFVLFSWLACRAVGKGWEWHDLEGKRGKVKKSDAYAASAVCCVTCCTTVFFTLFLVSSSAWDEFMEPNGELALWYAVAVCYSPAASASFGATTSTLDGVAITSSFDAYPMRELAPGGLPGAACPAAPPPAPAPPVVITLEASDGWRQGASYVPIFLIPTGSYLSIAMEVGDNLGVAILPRQTVLLGSDENYPWEVAGSTPSRSFHSVGCLNTCRYASDGTCDDGGPGAEYEHCGTFTDCADCQGAGRRLETNDRRPAEAVAVANRDATPPAGGRVLLSTPDRGLFGTAPPTSRVLLKGGSSVISSGGRSSVSGSGRWAGARVHSVRGRGGSYSYATNVYARHSAVLLVSSDGYGCYSCQGVNRTCQQCPSTCIAREQCGGERVTDVAYAQDRYELVGALTIPPRGSARWPLTLTVHDATLYAPRTSIASRGADVLVSFFTDEGDAYEALAESTQFWSIFLSILSVVAFFSFMHYRNDVKRCCDTHVTHGRQQQSVARRV